MAYCNCCKNSYFYRRYWFKVNINIFQLDTGGPDCIWN